MLSDTHIGSILTRFPGPVTLYPSPRKWLLMLAGTVLFTAGGIEMIREDVAGGWFVVIFFRCWGDHFGSGFAASKGRAHPRRRWLRNKTIARTTAPRILARRDGFRSRGNPAFRD
jgi:hypothetical protein